MHDEIYARIRYRGVLAYVQGEKNYITEPTVALNAIILHYQSSGFSKSPYLGCMLIPCSHLHSLLAQPWVPLPLTSRPRVLFPSHCIPWSELAEQWVTSMPEISPLKLLFFLWLKAEHKSASRKRSTAVSTGFCCSLGLCWTLDSCRHPRLMLSSLSGHPIDYCLFTSFSACALSLKHIFLTQLKSMSPNKYLVRSDTWDIWNLKNSYWRKAYDIISLHFLSIFLLFSLLRFPPFVLQGHKMKTNTPFPFSFSCLAIVIAL